MRRALTALTVTAALLLIGSTATAGGTDERATATDGQQRLVVRGGIIRLGTHVYLHTNGTHAAVGITSVTLVSNCYLRVRFDTKPGERVVSAVADEDETISRLDVQAGVSGGGYTADIRLYRSGRPVCANNRMFGTTSNLWLSMTYLAPASSQQAPAPEPQPEPEPTTEPTTPAPTTPEPTETVTTP